MELFLDVLSETLVDTAKMLPFLFLAYLFIEYVETRHGERIEALLAGGGRWGAVPGAVLGCVPQCGFSAIASNFYASRVITLGTLMAVYLATSDEAIPLLVSMPAYWDKLILLMVIKVVYAVFVGFLLDFVLRKALPRSLRGGYTGHADEVDCHEEHSDEEGHPQPIWKAALRHTLEIFVFIFVFILVFGLIVEGVGEDVFASVLGRMGFFQPVVAALVGLIPNCAASVLLTQLYVEGALRFSSLVASSSRTSRTVSRILISPYESSCSWHFARMSFARAFMLSSSMSLISFCISSLHVKQAGLARVLYKPFFFQLEIERVDFKSDKVKPRLIGCYAAASASKVSIEYLLPRLCIVFEYPVVQDNRFLGRVDSLFVHGFVSLPGAAFCNALTLHHAGPHIAEQPHRCK